ncbi:MFS transporter [Oceanomicrobium pacificus]|uniref:MFS transporter n=1 Tax=Oceanomicrobium pacificus TaxID=2692916 RepID=A0A6B0TVW8_9RHOB|nr:MFS transporter [Oceanomicrobium pacificus]MXU65304.1 MFS transporter [Oceanomicrobium pacificus]
MALFPTFAPVPVTDAHLLPRWRRPETLLVLMSIAVPLAFSTWLALLNNFVIERAAFDGVKIGWLQTVREIPGFLAVGVIYLLLFMREQTLAMATLLMLGAAVAVTGWFPSFQGLLLTTLVSSIGFHYFETVNQSLQLQWVSKARAPQLMGWLVAAGSGASLVVYGALVLAWPRLGLDYDSFYLMGGGATVLITLYCMIVFPKFESPDVQRKEIVLRRRYWLYYALQFMSGARRQIFVVFAAFMMVERFGFHVHEVTALFLINYVANMIFAPLMGKAVSLFGERRALVFEYAGLTLVFLAYGGIYYFGWGVVLAAVLYVVDHLFFALAFAMKTYFQKIADPSDIAPTSAVAFTINHIAAVFLPAGLGYLWVTSPGAVFGLAAAMAVGSLILSLMIPRHPEPGRETVFSRKPVSLTSQRPGITEG